MSYKNDRGILEEQKGQNGGANVIIVDTDGNPVVQRIGNVSILVVSTPAGGGVNPSVYAAFPCSALDIVNDTGVDIEYRRNGAGNYMPILAGTSRLISGISNANQIGVRRIDQAAAAVTVKAEGLVQ